MVTILNNPLALKLKTKLKVDFALTSIIIATTNSKR